MVKPSTLLIAFVMLGVSLNCTGTSSRVLPGRMSDDRVLLPNGWMLSPAGRSLQVGELPLNMDLTPDGRFLVVTNNGTRDQTLSVIDVKRWSVVQTIPLRKAWLGLRFIENGARIVVSGGNDNRVEIYDFHDGRASLSDSIVLGLPWPEQKIWVAGLDVDDPNHKAYVTGKESDSLYVLDLHTRKIVNRIPAPGTPYTCLLSHAAPFLYVSLWGNSSVALFDRNTLELVSTIPVGNHPCEMLESPDGKRLFVANANENTVSVIDLNQRKVTEVLSTSLFPNAPEGSTPNSLAITAEGKTLYIANADNNYLAVMDVSITGHAKSLGFIPVGWYPTCVRVLPGGKQIVVASAKGGSSASNPRGPVPGKPTSPDQYSGSMFRGTVSLIDIPDQRVLEQYTQKVYSNSPFSSKRSGQPGVAQGNPIPWKIGVASPIKHVFYVIKENRTYDQVFGNIAEGNGDPALCLFPDSVTPNLHALVKQFVLLDNFYADAEVSADGHNWSMGAYATDYVEKTWPTMYGGRGGEYEYEGGYPIVYPSAGYLWDNCQRHGISYRTYGEFVINAEKPGDSATAATPGLAGHVAPFYRGWDLDYSDVQRASDWMREFDEYERNGGLPQFQIIKLPNDHTAGTRRGSPTPRAYVAQNDRALGLIVERISHSRFWKESAIFVIEDDAQNGPDHVDAHRTEALAISPYTKHRFVDSDLYSTSSMVRTMELVLSLPPLSQFDAAAMPMYNSFTINPDSSPYVARESIVDLNEKNIAGAFGQKQSGEMNFSHEDATSELDLNTVIWKSVRGADSPMPSPVRGAFVRVIDKKDD